MRQEYVYRWRRCLKNTLKQQADGLPEQSFPVH